MILLTSWKRIQGLVASTDGEHTFAVQDPLVRLTPFIDGYTEPKRTFQNIMMVWSPVSHLTKLETCRSQTPFVFVLSFTDHTFQSASQFIFQCLTSFNWYFAVEREMQIQGHSLSRICFDRHACVGSQGSPTKSKFFFKEPLFFFLHVLATYVNSANSGLLSSESMVLRCCESLFF